MTDEDKSIQFIVTSFKRFQLTLALGFGSQDGDKIGSFSFQSLSKSFASIISVEGFGR